MRRILDVVVAGGALVAALPLFLIIGVAVQMADGSPIFFRQIRIGRNGRPFWLLKFRSMRAGCGGRQITASRDPRVTKIGRLLRALKLDELPQLINVLKGEMSLIGPRPEVPAYVDLTHPLWRAALRYRPGITSAASVAYRNEEEILAGAADPDKYYRETLLPGKLMLDLNYLSTRTLRSDVRLLLATARTSVLPNRGDAVRAGSKGVA
jgi:lipopolysaccharide/colanic/teichoic acid biosynthesis glycosyltransferase